jgi:NADPH:quinone reductase-like Zn-dependent oxidoreductase
MMVMTSNSSSTMRAMQAKDSDPASLSLDAVPVPSPGPDEVLVRVAATAVTSQELTWPEKWPAIPCHDLSGVVAEAGPGVTGWRSGDEVYGLIGFDRPGAAAEYTVIPAADLAAKPAATDPVATAALPLGALTAWQALHVHAGLQPGQRVLVHGGGGGVGAYVVQVAAAHGARVVATASARDASYVASLGAEQVIDYTGRFEDQVADVDVVVDPVGGEVMARSWPVLRPGGILIAIAEPPDGHGGRSDVRSQYFIVEPSGAQLSELARLVDKGQLRPAVSEVLPLSELREAFAAQHTRRRPGKVVIEVTPAPVSQG